MFELVSSHNEAISFQFAQFLHSDTIIEFAQDKTDWLQVSVKDKHRLVGTFNILFDQFEDNKRKECQVEFNSGSEFREGLPRQMSVFYEGQLILNELQYFKELSQINQEDSHETDEFIRQFSAIKQKLIGLVRNVHAHQRAKPESAQPGTDHLSLHQKLQLTKKGDFHHSLRASFVDNAVKTSMIPVDEDLDDKEITDRYCIHPLVHDGSHHQSWASTRRLKRGHL